MHLAKLAQLRAPSLAAVVVVRPQLEGAHRLSPGYYEIGPEAAALERRGVALKWIDVTLNEGQYAQLLSAYEGLRHLG